MSGRVSLIARLSTKAPSSAAMKAVASSRAREAAIPAASKRAARPAIQPSKTSAVACRRTSFVVASGEAALVFALTIRQGPLHEAVT